MLPEQPIPWRRRAQIQESKAESQRLSEKYRSMLHTSNVADSILNSSGYKPSPDEPLTLIVDAGTRDFPLPTKLAKYARSRPPILRKKDEPDDPIPMPFDPGHPDRPLSPATSSIGSTPDWRF